ncbi:Zn(II)2Cys6 transcription factor [Aspergillus undulatus]|uniref:Zn(II)2Cys6 transcription factor n=1 Tax=Aspergillus undulatus TaxID=1810928 RepID=UPI003CCD1459
MQPPRPNKAYDQCRARKFRCIGMPVLVQSSFFTSWFHAHLFVTVPPGGPDVCSHCIKRNETCQFSNLKRRLRVKEPAPQTDATSGSQTLNTSSDLFIAVLYDEFCVLGVRNDRVDSLVKRLGHTRVRDLVHFIDKSIRTRLLARPDKDTLLYSLAKARMELVIDPEASAHIQHLLQALETYHTFCGLYYAILALGCQYNDYSSFTPDNSHAWKLFQVSISRLDRILLTTECLLNLQTIFATNTFILQLDQTLLAKASRIVLALRYHKSIVSEGPTLCHRNFWVIYHLEKRYCFQASSSAIADYDFGCPIPTTPESILGHHDWLRSSVRYGRILAIPYEPLFSTPASTRPDDVTIAAIDHVRALLEEWRLLFPPDFRPKEPLQRCCLNDGAAKEIALRTHYYYYHLTIVLERLTLDVKVISLTRYIDVEPYTHVFILAIIPLSAQFVLFGFVVYHPNDPDIRGYLTLLDIVAGHFGQLDHASNGTIQSSYFSEFSHMARQYVQSIQNAEKEKQLLPAPQSPSGSQLAATTATNRTVTPFDASSSVPIAASDHADRRHRLWQIDNFYFLTPDSDWGGMTSLDECDPREYYGSIFQ